MNSKIQPSGNQSSKEMLMEQAEELLLQIEARTLYATRLIRLLLRQALSGLKLEIGKYDFDEMISMFADPTVRLNIYDIESSAEQYRDLVPDQAPILSALAHVVGKKYPFRYQDVGNLRQILGLDSEAVEEAHREIFGTPLDEIYSRHAIPDNRPFWLRLPGNMLQGMMKDLAKEVEWVYLPSGQILFEQGDVGDGLYTVVSGRIRIVSKDDEGAEGVVIERGRGSIFGEIAMLSEDQVRTATIYATRDTELAKLTVGGFERLFIKHPHFGLIITRLIVSGFREAVSQEYHSSQLSTLVILPIHASIPLDPFTNMLEEALSKHGSVFVLNNKRFDDFLGDGASQLPENSEQNSRLVAWLTDLEMANRFVILETDSTLTEWTRRCLRMADRTLLLANAIESPEITFIEKQIDDFQDARITSGRELVLLQPSRSQLPEQSNRWLKGRNITHHHHIHLNTPDDFSKLARMLSGRAVGLALSGGGARGLAHIGVIRAIQEAHIPIDAVGGTSFGSIVGACLGLEWEWKQIYQAMQKFIRTRSKYFRPALPFVSLIEGHRLSKLFQQYYGFVDLEDLWRPFLCLSANLTQSRLEILNQGPVWSAVRASMSLPGVFPPVLRNNQILVDGGVISNLPSDILKDRIEGGFVISSDTTVEESEFYEYRNDLSSWQILWAHANPRVKADRFPSIAKITAETMALASKWQRPQQLTNTDLLIHIPVEQYKMFDYDAIEELIELGYQKAVEMLQDWEET